MSFSTSEALQVLTLFCIFLLLIQCSFNESDPEKKNLPLTDELRLGTDSSDVADTEIFSFITEMLTDHQGRQYIVDARDSRIRVYDKKGEFLHYIGAQGSGPGEFQDISALFINQDNHLLAADPEQGRLSVFSLEGELLSTHKLLIPDAAQIAEMPDGRYLFVGFDGGNIVHLVDSNFTEIQVSFVSVKDILHTEDQLEEMWIQFDPGRVLVLAQDAVLFAPNIYAGDLYKYELTNSEWQNAATIRGYNRHRKPVTFSTYEQADRVDAPFTLPDGRFAAQFHSSSQGLFWNGPDRFMHFSLQEKNDSDQLELIAEQFSSEGDLLYYAVVDSMPRANISVHWMNDKYMYLFDRKDIPQLRKLSY